MTTDTRSGRKNKDNEISNSKNKLGSEGSSSSDFGKTDRSTRRSVQETSSKQVVSSPTSTRKSQRLEKWKWKLFVSPVKRKSERLEQQNTPSPLRRSDRCRMNSPSIPSTSRDLGREPSSSSIKRKEKGERIVKELTMETENVSASKKNAEASVGLKRKRMDARSYRLSFEKRNKGGTASDAREDGGIDGDYGSSSPSHLLHEVDLVEPEERRMLYNEQKSLHVHLKTEIAKLFGVLKFSEDIKRMAEKFLEYVTENHRVSREPETILQAFQISLCWIAASILKQKIDKDDTFLLGKQHLQYRCTKEEANIVYMKLRLLKKTFLQRLDQNGSASNSSRYPLSSVKSVGEASNKASASQAVVSTQPNITTEIEDGLQDKELSGEAVVTPKEKFMDSQREKIIKELQYGHDRRISMLGQKQQEEIEEFNSIWEKKKEVLEEERRLEVAVLRSIHGQTAETKDRQKALETEFARKMETHKCFKDRKLKEIGAKYSAKRKELKQKFSLKEKFMDDQREKIIKDAQYRHDRRISMLGKEQQEEIEEFHRIWEKKKEELEEECRLEVAAVCSIHVQTAETKDRQKALETEFARKMEVHKCLKDQKLKELEANYSAKRKELLLKSSSWCAREKSFLGGHYAGEIHLLGSDSGDEMERSQETLNVPDNIHKTVAPVCGQHVELLCPGNVACGTQDDMSASDAPVSSTVECQSLPVQSTGVLASSVSKEKAEITSMDRELVAAVEQSNEAGNSGESNEEIACKVPLPPKEHIGEVASDKRSRDRSTEISETSLNEVVADDQISDTKNNMPESNSYMPNVMENQRDCAEPVPSSNNANSLPQNPVYADECSRSSGDNRALDNKISLSENQVGTQIEAVVGCSINNTSEAMLVDSCEQQHTVSDGVPIAPHHTQRTRSPQTYHTICSIPMPGSYRDLDRDTAEPLHQAFSPARENLERCASVVVSDTTVAHDQSTLPAVSRVHPQSTTDLCASSQNSEAAFQVIQSSAEPTSRAVSQPNANVASIQRSSNILVHPAHQLATWNSSLPSHADPLQIEWERTNKEKEQLIKGHEDMKLRLKSECKKEIEDIIVPILKKFDLKLQEAEAAYLLKKNELDMNQKKIRRNKLLADAFKFKCMDLKIPVLAGVQQVPPGYMQHLDPVWLQHGWRSSPVTCFSSASEQASAPACSRSSPVSGLSSAQQPVEGQQTTVPSSPVANCSVFYGGISRPALISTPVGGSSSSGQPAAGQQTAAVNRSTAFSTVNVRRPPLISTITPSRGNPRLGGEIRAPAPHLQPFGAPTLAPVSSPSTLPNSMQGHSRPIKVAASSPSLPQLASLQTSPPSQVLQHQIQPPIVPLLPVNLSDTRSTSLEHGLGGLPAIQNPFLSAQELLQEMENRSRANMPNNMLPLPDIGCNFDSLDLSDFQSLGSVQGGSTPSVTATNKNEKGRMEKNALGSNRDLTEYNPGRGSFGEIYGCH